MRIRGLSQVFTNPSSSDLDKKADAFAELIQCLDDTSLSLIIRDARDDGGKALNILHSHYLPKGKPRIITLYTELTSLKLEKETITDFIIRAETLASQLRDAKEIISDGLLIAMIMKALPTQYKAFTDVMNQKEDDLTFTDFKILLRNYEDQEKIHSGSESTSPSVMSIMSTNSHQSKHSNWCSYCKMKSRNTNQCYKKPQAPNSNHKQYCPQNMHQPATPIYCNICKNHSHDTRFCRKSKRPQYQSARSFTTTKEEDSINHFMFHVTVKSTRSKPSNVDLVNSLLIDSGETTHILTSKEKFNNFNHSFNPQSHIVQLADGSKAKNVVQGIGDAIIQINDQFGESCDIKLKNVLFIPSFDQDIFSIPAATTDGAIVNFSETSGSVQIDGHTFDIQKFQSLYYLNSAMKSNNQRKTLSEWHNILGHCNVQDVLSVEKHVDGMEINGRDQGLNCETCVLGKMVNLRNKQPDARAEKPLELVHLDLAGPIEPVALDGYRYSLVCVDDFSNLTIVYFLRQKSDTTIAFKKFLADVSPLGLVKRVRSDNGGSLPLMNSKMY